MIHQSHKEEGRGEERGREGKRGDKMEEKRRGKGRGGKGGERGRKQGGKGRGGDGNKERILAKIKVTVFSSLIIEVASHHLCCTLLFRTRSILSPLLYSIL